MTPHYFLILNICKDNNTTSLADKYHPDSQLTANKTHMNTISFGPLWSSLLVSKIQAKV